jgi:hypothetical protein
MIKNIIFIFSIIIFITSCSSSKNNITKSKTIKWNSDKSIQIFQRSDYKQDFFELSGFFQPQINPLYCGIASSVIILNAINSNNNIPSQKELEIKKPEIFGGGKISFNSYSQLTFLNEKTNKIKKKEIINMKNINDEKENIDPGLTLEQLKKILESYDLEVKKYYTNNYSKKEIDFFRNKIKKVTSDKEKYLLINFNGKKLDLKTGGHISPLVAYDKKGDNALIMDVAGHKNNWYWVKLEDLFKAMNTKDGDNYRGYLIIKSKK